MISDQGLLTLVPEEIERYAMAHTTPLPPLLEELITVTQERFGRQARMLSGQLEGTLLQMLIASMGARRVLEVGTFTGFAAQMMAAALPDDGELITCDVDAKAIEVAKTISSVARMAARSRCARGPRWKRYARWNRRSISCSSTPTRRTTSITTSRRCRCLRRGV